MALVFRNSPEAPAQCALELSRADKLHPELRLRMGIHSGPINEVSDVNERVNVTGAGINMAQRVMDCGDAGHILLSKRAADDLAQYRHWQPLLHDLGECEVKHGVRLEVVNLYSDGLGNPSVPSKLRSQAEDLISRSRSRRRGLFALTAAIVLSLGSALWWGATRPAKPVAPAVSGPVFSDTSIAVLPFENLSSDKDNEYFASGMQDMILTKLSEIHELKVLSRTSTEKYKSHPDDLKAIAQKLGVAHFLEGSVQKSGNQVLINLQLIDAATEQHVWAQAYTRTLDNVFGVEGEVAQTVAEALKAKLSPAEVVQLARLPTQNKTAYDLYLKAAYYLQQMNRTLDRENLNRSIDLARQAIELDPNFAEAFCLLALDYDKLGGHFAEEEMAAQRALALAPDNACGHKHMAFVLEVKGNLPRAIEEAQKAVRIEPGNPSLQSGLGFVLMTAGRFDEAAETFTRAAELLPNENFLAGTAAYIDLIQRRYDHALHLLRIPVARDPTDIKVAALLALTLQLGWGDLDGARKVLESIPAPVADSGPLSAAWFEQDFLARSYAAALNVIGQAPAAWFENEKIPRASYLARAYQAAGDDDRAREAFANARTQIVGWLKATGDDARLAADLHASLALALAGLGENDAALKEAQLAVSLLPVSKHAAAGPRQLLVLAAVQAQAGHAAEAIAQLRALLEMPAGAEVSVPLLKLDPGWDSIRMEPRFQQLLTDGKLIGPNK